MVQPISLITRKQIEKRLLFMGRKELENIARDEKVSVRSVQRIYKNLKHHGHTYSLPSAVPQGRPRRFTLQMEQVCTQN